MEGMEGMEGIAHNPPALKQRNGRENNPRSSSEAVARRARRGFNLIEAAIVLAVVGLVIGGIWAAASAVMEKYRINRAVEGMIFMIDGLNRILPRNDSIVGEDLGPLIYEANLVPQDFKNPADPYSALDPWGHSFNAYATATTIETEYNHLSKSVCVDLSVKLTTALSMMDFYTIPGPFYKDSGFPLTVAEASNACTSDDNQLNVNVKR